MKKIDPWLLKAIEDAVGFPDKPYDLTKVKAITKWRNKCDPQLQLWRGGMLARDWLEIEAGAFDILGELPNLHTLIFPWGFSHKDYAFLRSEEHTSELQSQR